MPGKKRISLKEKGFAKDFLETRNLTESAMRNYGCKNRASAAAIGTHAITQPNVVKEIDRLMAERNITDDFLMQKLKEGLDANVVTSFRGDAEETDIPDQFIRHKFWQDAAKMKGWLKENVDVRSLNIDMQLENMSPGQLAELLTGMLKELKTEKQNANL